MFLLSQHYRVEIYAYVKCDKDSCLQQVKTGVPFFSSPLIILAISFYRKCIIITIIEEFVRAYLLVLLSSKLTFEQSY